MASDWADVGAKEINARLDLWIADSKAKGIFPGNGREGQEYLATMIAQALREAEARGMERAAKIAEAWYERFGWQLTDLGCLAVAGAIRDAAKGCKV